MTTDTRCPLCGSPIESIDYSEHEEIGRLDPCQHLFTVGDPDA